MLKKYHPIYCNTHFNHPWEITPESSKACEMLADAGVLWQPDGDYERCNDILLL